MIKDPLDIFDLMPGDQPCPYCGCKVLGVVTEHPEIPDWRVECDTCCARGPLGTTREKARERWNARSAEEFSKTF